MCDGRFPFGPCDGGLRSGTLFWPRHGHQRRFVCVHASNYKQAVVLVCCAVLHLQLGLKLPSAGFLDCM